MFPKATLVIRPLAVNAVNKFFGSLSIFWTVVGNHLPMSLSHHICVVGKVAPFSKEVQLYSSFFGMFWKCYCLYNPHFVAMDKFKVSCHFWIWLRAIKAILLLVRLAEFRLWWWHWLNKSLITRQGVCLFRLAFHLFWWWYSHKLIRWTTCLVGRCWMYQSTFDNVMSRRTTIRFIWADFWYVWSHQTPSCWTSALPAANGHGERNTVWLQRKETWWHWNWPKWYEYTWTVCVYLFFTYLQNNVYVTGKVCNPEFYRMP